MPFSSFCRRLALPPAVPAVPRSWLGADSVSQRWLPLAWLPGSDTGSDTGAWLGGDDHHLLRVAATPCPRCGKMRLFLSPPGRESQCSRKNRSVGNFAGWGMLFLGFVTGSRCRAACRCCSARGGCCPFACSSAPRAELCQGQLRRQTQPVPARELPQPPRGATRWVVLAGDSGRVVEELGAFPLTQRGFQAALGDPGGEFSGAFPWAARQGSSRAGRSLRASREALGLYPAENMPYRLLLATHGSPAGGASPQPRSVAGLDWTGLDWWPHPVEGC